MPNRIKIILFVCLAVTNFTVYAEKANYIGIDYKFRWMRGQSGSNYTLQQVLPSIYQGGEIYYAHRFESNVGFDLVYEQSQNKLQTHVFSNQESFLGDPQHAGDSTAIRNRIMAGQFNIMGYLTFLKHTEALGQLGFSIMHADMTGTVKSAGVTTNLVPSKNYKFIPRVGLGVQYLIDNLHLGARAMLAWEGTNLYRLKMTDDDGVRHTVRPFKQSWCFTVGLVAKW